MAGKGISGNGGDVLLGTGTPVSVAEIRNWNFTPKSTNPGYRSNRTGGFTARVQGYKDGSGSVAGAWDPTAPITAILDVGSLVTFNLRVTGTQEYVVPGIVDSLKLAVDLESAEIVGWSVDFSTNGAWTNPVAATLLPPNMGAAPRPLGSEQAWWRSPEQGSRSEPQPQPQEHAARWWGPQEPTQPSQLAPQANAFQEAVAARVPGADPALVAAVTDAVMSFLSERGLLQTPGRGTPPAQQPAGQAA